MGSTDSIDKGPVPTMNSSGLIENVTFKNLNFIQIPQGVTIQNHSYVEIANSNFMNNTVRYGLITVLNSGTLVMSDCSVLRNWAKHAAILAKKSMVYITNTYFNDNKAVETGAIINAEINSFLHVQNCTFHNNSSPLNGGALYVQEHSTLNISNTNFIHNSAVSGGAVSVDSHSILEMSNCSFTRNSAINNGGGLFLKLNTTATIFNVTFTENEADDGGAIYAQNRCQIAMFRSLFAGNTESAVSLLNYNNLYADGCHFYNNSRAIKGTLHSQINVTDTEFIQNKAIEGGSLHVSKATILYLHNCSFTDNFASWKGGIIAAVNSDSKVFDCKFTQNGAMIGGGVFTISGTLFVKDSVISNNYVHGDGGVAYLEENSLVEIQDSYFLMNTAEGVGGVLSMTRSTARVSNSSFVSNRAPIRGGVIDAQYLSMINISRTTCYGNQVTNGYGGVVHARVDTKVYVNNSIFQRTLLTLVVLF